MLTVVHREGKKAKLVSVYNGFLANRSRLPRAHCQLCPRPTDCKKRFYCHVVKFASINLWIYADRARTRLCPDPPNSHNAVSAKSPVRFALTQFHVRREVEHFSIHFRG